LFPHIFIAGLSFTLPLKSLEKPEGGRKEQGVNALRKKRRAQRQERQAEGVKKSSLYLKANDGNMANIAASALV